MESKKKDCILSCAAKIFSRFGLKKASVGEIAESAGVAKGTIYLACESKEDLFYQVLHRELRDWLSDSAKAIDARKPASELLLPVLLTGFERFEDRPLVRDLFAGQLHSSMRGWEKQMDALYELGRSNIVEVLNLGVKQAVFPKELAVDEVARSFQDLLVAAVFHTQLRPRSAEGREEARRRFAAGVNLMLGGLRTA